MGTLCSKGEASRSQKQSGHNHETKLKQVHETKQATVELVNQQQLPYNYEAIVKDADSPIKPEDLFGRLYAGIFLNQNRKKYWLDKKSNNCFMVYPRDLAITWGEDKRYWQWFPLEETSNVSIDVAELLWVCWLYVEGKFDTTKLSPGILYEVVFVVMLKAGGLGWEIPVNVRLTLPDGNKHERKVNFEEKVTEQWIEIPVGEFRALPGKLGDIEFLMKQPEEGRPKGGLCIKGVAIRPKK